MKLPKLPNSNKLAKAGFYLAIPAIIIWSALIAIVMIENAQGISISPPFMDKTSFNMTMILVPTTLVGVGMGLYISAIFKNDFQGE